MEDDTKGMEGEVKEMGEKKAEEEGKPEEKVNK